MSVGEELGTALRRATRFLGEAGVHSPRVDAELLAAHCISKQTGEQVSRGRVQILELMGSDIPQGFAELVNLRAERIPLQHLTGKAYFRELTLEVGPGVFIPRPETEELVTRVLQEIDARSAPLKIVDLCTGSGAIAASIATERTGHTVKAVELSELALGWASRNTASCQVELIQGNALIALAGEESSVDIVASNPPYIPENAVPQDIEVREHDPEMALYGGSEDGLKIPQGVAERAFQLLKPGGFLVMEHAETQGLAMHTVFQNCGFERIESIQDLSGRARHTAGYKPE